MPWEPLPREDDPDPVPMSSSIDRIRRHLGAATPAVTQSVFDLWPGLVGDAVASKATPVSLRDQVLTVAVTDPAWATQLRYLEHQLLDQLREALGPDEVTRIELKMRA